MLTDCCQLGTDKTAAPAAVFPSARASGGPNWRRLDYLAEGNPRQRSAHALLTAGLWAELQRLCQDLALVSTVAIGLDKPGSDLDILCQHPDPAAFAALFASGQWQTRPLAGGNWLVTHTLTGMNAQAWPVELYVTPARLETLHGWRHLSLMAALLEQFGDDFYRAVLRLRREQGLKGEAAICQLLGLAGDPYQALLAQEGVDLNRLVWQSAPLTHAVRLEDTLLP
ncbi:DUF4269 domain-containing protein [Aeromonas tecta]|uniref:DUF4269 domain-containing protein n=1 Tax=Aeromonas tecta TaxID=324617 RepID=UPI0009FA8A03|nr:DUF4269 domain-containing protein [Aeromonas tecta]